MGLYSAASLIWGIPVTAYDDEGEPTEFWDEEAEDWREFEGDLVIVPYGHYEDSCPLGILTSRAIKSFRGDCWEPTQLDWGETEDTFDEAVVRAQLEAGAAGLSVDFTVKLPGEGQSDWWLVASYG